MISEKSYLTVIDVHIFRQKSIAVKLMYPDFIVIHYFPLAHFRPKYHLHQIMNSDINSEMRYNARHKNGNLQCKRECCRSIAYFANAFCEILHNCFAYILIYF
jgi:hypothetical protein